MKESILPVIERALSDNELFAIDSLGRNSTYTIDTRENPKAILKSSPYLGNQFDCVKRCRIAGNPKLPRIVQTEQINRICTVLSPGTGDHAVWEAKRTRLVNSRTEQARGWKSQTSQTSHQRHAVHECGGCDRPVDRDGDGLMATGSPAVIGCLCVIKR